MDAPPKTLEQLAAEAHATFGQRACPHCGCRHFLVLRTWYTVAGEKHRSYRCRHCGGHEFNAAVKEDVLPL